MVQTTIANAVCQLIWPSFSANNLCTSVVNRQAGCNGDDGGPLTIFRNGLHLQIGILISSACGVSFLISLKFYLKY